MNIATMIAGREGNCIMLYTTPEAIARKRAAAEKQWRDDEAAIPRRYALAKAMLTERDDLTARHGRRLGAVLAKHAGSTIAKADPLDKIAAQRIVEEMRAEYGIATPALAKIVEMVASMKAQRAYWDALAEIDRIEKRSLYWRYSAVGY
ncbi:hypothetical protein AC629_27860 [Bradyrhizobium sp. NAS80.1]|uniref:hypothetical protein n=1 Tax=Bradyrhizobium sp. NAS80.1 TaxID=1680159 RepID=UPI000968404E|nr:hypothetical protein [Bradyrhizobium sp. NAS80.1]OKO80150.1 hypothetical protein AC629_27860 [Bradyrhizobium sp. NAS80.1]